MDRFLMHVMITYPPVEDEVEVIRLVRGEEIAALRPAEPKADADAAPKAPRTAIPQASVFAARAEISAVHVSDAIERYMADLVYATRTPGKLGEDLARWIKIGASPRASLALDKCGRAHAWLNGPDYVDPQDVRAIAHDVFRHRITLSYEAQGDGKSADGVIDEILRLVAIT